MKLLLVGGNTGGPVAPLLAVAEVLKTEYPNTHFLLVGTNGGVEAAMAKQAHINFEPIAAGKLRRYVSWRNLFSVLFVSVGFVQSLRIIKKFKPDCAFGAGGFVQVPLLWAAWLLGVPVVIHQQDVQASLANKLCSPIAKKITVTFEASLRQFSEDLGLFSHGKKSKIVLTGNPFRVQLTGADKNIAVKKLSLEPDFPTLLVLGGGGGAEYLNNLILNNLSEITKFMQIVHITGPGKKRQTSFQKYHAYEFLADMGSAYAAADIVLARGGVSTITELSNLKKTSIVIPMPGTHQELNCEMLWQKNAAIVLNQNKINQTKFIKLLHQLLFDAAAQQTLQHNIAKVMPHNSSQKVAKVILEVANKKHVTIR